MARRSVRDLPKTIADLSELLAKLAADEATITARAAFPFVIGNRPVSRIDAAAALAGQMDALPSAIREKIHVPFGTYRGLRFGMVLHPQWAPEVFLEGGNASRHAFAGPSRTPRQL